MKRVICTQNTATSKVYLDSLKNVKKSPKVQNMDELRSVSQQIMDKQTVLKPADRIQDIAPRETYVCGMVEDILTAEKESLSVSKLASENIMALMIEVKPVITLQEFMQTVYGK